MRRKCDCSGNCGSENPGLTRRGFLGLAGSGTAAALLLESPFAHAKETDESLERWKRALFEPAVPRVYRSDVHKDARLHLGGIGTGNFELGADGQLTTWQLFNTLRDGQVPFAFAVKAGGVARWLQTAGGPDGPRVQQIEMTGEYPVARLRFIDRALPVQLELTAFSPFAPLDTRLSSAPLAAFVFRLTNPSPQAQEVQLAALLTNPVGYEAFGRLEAANHPDVGGNVNEPFREGAASGVFLRAEPATEPTLDQAVTVYTTAQLQTPGASPANLPPQLEVQGIDRLPKSGAELKDPKHTVIWLEEAPADFLEAHLRAAREAVQAGATLVFAGRSQPLLAAYASVSGGRAVEDVSARADILFEDFESGYDRWTAEGTAFGTRPATGTLPNQQRVSGFLGRGLVNTYLEGDGTVGRLVSKPFTIERHYVRFLVGGGAHADTQMRLVVDGQVVRSAAGRDNERLLPTAWDVRELEGRQGRLEIVDQNRGGWGHINIDQIEFSDRPANLAALLLLDELLPARFSEVRPMSNESRPNTVSFTGLQAKEGAAEQSTAQRLSLWVRPCGQGRVVLAAGPLLEAEEAQYRNRRHQALAVLCSLTGAKYVAPAGTPLKAPGFGSLALAVLAGQATVRCDLPDLATAWQVFAKEGRFNPLGETQARPPSAPGQTFSAAVASTVNVPAGGTVEVPFLLTWHYPNKYNAGGQWMGCHYTTLWPDARAVVREAAANWAVWRERTERFRRVFYDSTLPYWLLDCLTSQAAIIRHVGVVFRTANGDSYGWEGSNGCCQPTCTHVWGYEQTLARLFPDLERDMRRIDFKHQQRPDGGVNNRTDVPSPPRPTGEQPFADGHASCILKAWREALNQPDDGWLKEYWPHAKKAVEYLIARDAATAGGEPAGVLQDDQWNTYDEALHGVTTFIGTYYLAALRAGEEWARRLGDTTAADRFQAVFQKGQKELIRRCWNGEYFQQDLPDYQNRTGEVGPGCMSDQLIGQWWGHQLGLGYLLPQDMVRSALRAVFKYNWKSDLTGWPHSPRAFAGERDRGLIICTWPKGGRPGSVMLYSDEVWTGIEYQVAAHLIYEGFIEEGFALIKGARDRYDGRPRPPIARNPWNEIECGGHYARAMSSWSLLLALSGYEYDGPRQALRFTPRHRPEHFRSFFSGPTGWGTLTQKRQGGVQHDEVALEEGRLVLRELRLEAAQPVQKVTVTAGAQALPVRLKTTPAGLTLEFASTVTLNPGERLLAVLG